ncbi:GTP cyclohydrolase II [Salipiger sp. IMCC34102]|uniref:GTP cyclohydrolase II n=1 Tax=Salipiger sp. IMCC34102 TaxID=2510647 RepID=UPI00101DD8EE|nr:GTP cyclohydrolase II [Salipiger sp. IMCC34102]RYH04069.1 GTP cyclohydrolase II [Salipiger sp. IMCC34102]
MGLSPDNIERLARARADLAMGVPVAVAGEGLIVPAETLTPDRLTVLQAMGAQLALTDWRARTLKLAAYDGDLARVALPRDATVDWVRALADPAGDLDHPLKGPLRGLRDGSASLARLAISLCKSAHLLPAALIVPTPDAAALAQAEGLTLIEPGVGLAPLGLRRVSSARLPMAVSSQGRVHVFRPDDGSEEHYAIEIGYPDRTTPVLTRLHSACFTGDLLHSLKCDCGPQLRAALAQMGGEGAGVLLYLNQEGRGIGLANKMRAYALQDQGFDTVEANHRLGFQDDERDFRVGAAILTALGFARVRLLTNNPAKIARMEEHGVRVTERVPLKVGLTEENAGYLATKAAKSGHLL